MDNSRLVIEVSASLVNVQENLIIKPIEKQAFEEKLEKILEIILRDRFFSWFMFTFNSLCYKIIFFF